MKVITLGRPAVCKSCGASIPAGSRARYYSNDQIYCETHQKDAQGHEIPNTGTIPQTTALMPLAEAPSEPQGMSITPEMIGRLVDSLAGMTNQINWAIEKVALATDFLNTLCILMRQNQEARNDKAKQDNGPAKATPARTAQKLVK